MSDYAAAAFKKMLDAKGFSVHREEIRIDAIARLEQAFVMPDAFHATRRGTRDEMCWYRLDQSKQWRVVDGPDASRLH